MTSPFSDANRTVNLGLALVIGYGTYLVYTKFYRPQRKRASRRKTTKKVSQKMLKLKSGKRFHEFEPWERVEKTLRHKKLRRATTVKFHRTHTPRARLLPKAADALGLHDRLLARSLEKKKGG